MPKKARIFLSESDAERVAKVIGLKKDGDVLHQNVYVHAKLYRGVGTTVLTLTFEGD